MAQLIRAFSERSGQQSKNARQIVEILTRASAPPKAQAIPRHFSCETSHVPQTGMLGSSPQKKKERAWRDG